MKRFLVILMAAVLLLSSMGIASAETTYENHVTYHGSGWMLDAEANYDDAMYEFFSEKFNFDFEPFFTDSATNDEKVMLLVNTSSMPDGMCWTSFNYDTYLEWVDQGLIAPLPDGWQEKYPNMYDMMQATGILDVLTIDGKVYTVPHAIWYNFVDIAEVCGHSMIYYRKDWAEELGMLDKFEGGIVTLADLMEFCKAAVDANLGDNGTTVGYTGHNNSYVIDHFFNGLDMDYKSFNKTEEGYKWGPAMEGVVDCIKTIREYYEMGAIDPDFFLGNGKTTFQSGGAAALAFEGTPGGSVGKHFVNAHPELVAKLDALKVENPVALWFDTGVEEEYIGYAIVAQNDGQLHYGAKTNFWSCNVYNPDIDPEVFDRILAVTDYLCTPEGEVTVKIGLKGIDWDWDETGKGIVQYLNADGTYNDYESRQMLTQYALCSDEVGLLKVTNSKTLRDFIRWEFEEKEKGVVTPYDTDYNYFVSQAKSEYSVDVRAEVVSLVVDASLDIDAEWKAFIEENAGMVEPVIEDLNAAFYPELG